MKNPKQSGDAADDFEVAKPANKAPTPVTSLTGQSYAAQRIPLPKPGPPPPKIEKVGGGDPTKDDAGNTVVFKGDLPDDLPTLWTMLGELQEIEPASFVKDRKGLLEHRAKLRAVADKVFRLQQIPTAPQAKLQFGPSASRIESLKQKLSKITP